MRTSAAPFFDMQNHVSFAFYQTIVVIKNFLSVLNNSFGEIWGIPSSHFNLSFSKKKSSRIINWVSNWSLEDLKWNLWKQPGRWRHTLRLEAYYSCKEPNCYGYGLWALVQYSVIGSFHLLFGRETGIHFVGEPFSWQSCLRSLILSRIFLNQK